MDLKVIKEKIQLLIKNGKIKNEEELKNVPIDILYKKYELCVDDLLCYFCKSNSECDSKCKKEQ